jgi:adenylate cyclase
VLKVQFLGALTFSVGDRVLSGLPKKAQALIAYLAAEPGRLISRERLADLLWSDCASDTGRHRLRSALLAVRNALGIENLIIAAEGDGLRLIRASTWADIVEFEHLANAQDERSLSAAANLYQGEFLTDLPSISPVFDEWAQLQRARLLEIASGVLMRLSDLRSGAGDHTGAVSAAQKLVGLDRLSEEAHRTLMRAYANAGRPASALKQYQECKGILKAELGIGPSTSTSALAQQIAGKEEQVLTSEPHGAGVASLSSAPPAPDKPSIAVLPFTNMSGDPEQEFFADGMTEDIITGLSRLKWLFVIARHSTFTYKGKAVDVRQVSRELGVRYVLEGSVRAYSNRIRISGQLIDAGTGKHIWAEKYDRQLEDVFAVQDEITQNVIATIEPFLYSEEGFRSAQQPPESVATWGLVVRAITLINKIDRKANQEAQDLLELAISKEPAYARAYAILAWAKWWQVFSQWFSERNNGIDGLYRETEELAERALALDPDEPWARMTFGLTLSGSGHHDRALEQFQTALDAHPNWALGRTMYGVALLRAGCFDDAISETGHALRMSPVDPFAGLYTVFHGLALLGARRYPEALVYLRRSIKGLPDLVSHYNPLISCCGHLGLMEEAQMYLQKRNSITGTTYRVSVVRQGMRRFAHGDVFVEGLLKANVPE